MSAFVESQKKITIDEMIAYEKKFVKHNERVERQEMRLLLKRHLERQTKKDTAKKET